jgi:hypothetical protein
MRNDSIKKAREKLNVQLFIDKLQTFTFWVKFMIRNETMYLKKIIRHVSFYQFFGEHPVAMLYEYCVQVCNKLL